MPMLRLSLKEVQGLRPIWRVGHPNKRGLYVQAGARPRSSDQFIGIMSSPDNARFVVRLVNREFREQQREIAIPK